MPVARRIFLFISGPSIAESKSPPLHALSGADWQGVEEYQNMIDLHEGEKKHIRMMQQEDAEWCETFDRVIGPFQEKYDQCQRDVVKLAEHGKAVYNVSFQKLIDEFGFHPAFKRWFDDF